MSFESLSASSDIEDANLFAKYFASNFQPSSLWNDDDSLSAIATMLNIGCLDVTDFDCYMSVESFNDSGKLCCDGLFPFILKNCIGVFCEPLKIIFKKSLSTGVCAHRWKLATVSPIFKSGYKNIVSNYRPIANVCCMLM